MAEKIQEIYGSHESACSEGDPGWIPGLKTSPGEGNGYPVQYSCLENSMDRGAWRSPRGHRESDTTERLMYYAAYLAYYTHRLDYSC